jgi:hypothetical protein
MTKKQVFMGYIPHEVEVARDFAAGWIKASRYFECSTERIRVRSAHAIHVDDGTRVTQFILRKSQQDILDDEFNASVWDDFEAKAQAELERDQAITDSEHPWNQMEEYHSNCM